MANTTETVVLDTWYALSNTGKPIMTPWEIKATEFVNCNCAYGCPCQFNALPTHGNCEAMGAMEIITGHYGGISLDGVKFAFLFQWPGPVHEGQGKCLPIVDSSASPEQREAILMILSGEDSDPGATSFQVYASTMEEVFEPRFEPIHFEADVENRRGRVKVDGILEFSGGPIINSMTGNEHRARIDLPNGFEYSIAEVGSASGNSHGPIELSLKDSYGQFAHIHMNNHGPIRN